MLVSVNLIELMLNFSIFQTFLNPSSKFYFSNSSLNPFVILPPPTPSY